MLFRTWFKSKIQGKCAAEARPEITTWKSGDIITYTDGWNSGKYIQISILGKVVLRDCDTNLLIELNLWDDMCNRTIRDAKETAQHLESVSKEQKRIAETVFEFPSIWDETIKREREQFKNKVNKINKAGAIRKKKPDSLIEWLKK